MSDLDIMQISNTRYRTSGKADDYTTQLQQKLALETRAQVARLAIGKSLGMGALQNDGIDSQGKDIQAITLFASERQVIGAWVGLLVSHGLAHGHRVDSLETLREAIRNHWHRGALALWDDWRACDENYDTFVQKMIARSNMPAFGKPTDLPRDGESIPHPHRPEEPQNDSDAVVKALAGLGIEVQVQEPLLYGPRITRYRLLLLDLADAKKLEKSMGEIALALNLGNALPLLMPGDQAMTKFLDVPRPPSTWKTVDFERLRAWHDATPRAPGKLMIYVGVDVTGRQDVAFDLVPVPHLLIAGTTGAGKSVCLHSILLSLLLAHGPEALQLALIDPKQVELALYSELPHVYGGDIATDVAAARDKLSALCDEMEARYSRFHELKVRNISEAHSNGESLPFIVCVIEEMADLLLQDKSKSIEDLIVRLAQKGRAAGIHLVLATQRPDAKTMPGLIRSNAPGRIALTVQKSTESTIILDETGAENLLKQGDMLIKLPGENSRRAHGVFVRPDDIKQVVRTVSSRAR